MKQNKWLAVSSFAILTSMSLCAMAGGINYNYIGATYDSLTDSSLGTNINAHGLTIGGSVGVNKNVVISANTVTASYDSFQGVSIDARAYDVGATLHTLVTPQADVFGRIALVHESDDVTSTTQSYTTSDSGNSISGGIKFAATNSVILSAALTRTTIFSNTSNTTGVGALLYVNDNTSVILHYSTGDNVDTTEVGLRYDYM